MHYTIKTEGMRCGHCEATVEAALMRVPGVSDAEADSATNTVEVDGADTVSADALTAAVEGAGEYRAISISSEDRS